MEQQRCPYCGEKFGVYDPIRVVLANRTERCGSGLTLGDFLQAPGSVVVREPCYALWPAQREEDPPTAEQG